MNRWIDVFVTGATITAGLAMVVVFLAMAVTALWEDQWPKWQRALFALPLILLLIVVFGLIGTSAPE